MNRRESGTGSHCVIIGVRLFISHVTHCLWFILVHESVFRYTMLWSHALPEQPWAFLNKVLAERRGAQGPVAGPDVPERDSGHLYPHPCAACRGPWLWPVLGGLSGHFWKMALFQPVGCRSGQHGTGKCLGRWVTTNDYAPCRNNRLRASPEKNCAYEINSPMKTWKNTNVNKTFQV